MKNTVTRISRLQTLAEGSPYPHEAEAAKRMLEKLLAEEEGRLQRLADTCTENWQKLLAALFIDLELDADLAEKSLRNLTEMWNKCPFKYAPEYASGIFSGVIEFLRFSLYKDLHEAQDLIDRYEQIYHENFGGYEPENDDINSYDIEKRHRRARHVAGYLRGGAVIRRIFGDEYFMGSFELMPDEYWIDEADNKYMSNKLRFETPHPLTEEDRKKS